MTLRWYLSFCKRSNIRVNVYSAREFIDWVVKEKDPTAHSLEEWKEAIRWFFREAKKPTEGFQHHPTPVQKIEFGNSDWRRDLIQVIRRRHYSIRTGKSYCGWVRRFERHFKAVNLSELGEPQIKEFLDHLAVNERSSVSRH
ncbi:MAG TPA: hypothetical protein EYQ50_12065 [Verrucomicrobiales bacterium]|nr:hypothetical protein [Verrucomicrobiales bacterium]